VDELRIYFIEIDGDDHHYENLAELKDLMKELLES